MNKNLWHFKVKIYSLRNAVPLAPYLYLLDYSRLHSTERIYMYTNQTKPEWCKSFVLELTDVKLSVPTVRFMDKMLLIHYNYKDKGNHLLVENSK